MTDSTRPRLLTIDEAAAQLRVSRDWVRKAIKSGVIDGTKIGTGTVRFRWLVSQDELDRYVKQQTKQHDRELLAAAKASCRRLPLPPSRFRAAIVAAQAGKQI